MVRRKADVSDVTRVGHRRECLCYLRAAEHEAVYSVAYVTEVGFVAVF